jgi:hypothetical protein
MSRGSSFESFRLGLGNPIPFFLHNRAAPTRPGSRVGPNKPTVFTFKKKQKVITSETDCKFCSSFRWGDYYGVRWTRRDQRRGSQHVHIMRGGGRAW